MPVTNASSAIKAGTVAYFAASSPPAGWLAANGAAVSRTTYAALFNAIGTTFGTGDGSTTFNLPDLRGEFIRGWDNGRGVDSGRTFGSAQSHQMQSHVHTYPNALGGGYNPVAGLTVLVDGSASVAYNSSATGGTSNGSENRPRNIALLACIKF